MVFAAALIGGDIVIKRPNDEHLVLMTRVAKRRDRSAFRTLYLYYGPRVKAMMMKAGAEFAHAEDLAQDVMMTVWRKSHLYAPGRGSVSAWIFAIARNVRIDNLRRGSSRPYEDVDEIEIVADDPGGEETAIATQRAVLVAQAMAELPDEQRQIIELGFIHDLPQSEIASKLELPLGTVKSRTRLAYAKLRTNLEEFR